MSDDLQPFRIEIPQADVEYLRDRLANARWPGELPGVEWARGIPLDYMKDLAGYWRTQYDWRAQEAKLNQFPQFTTEIDGQRIHFLHVRSGQPGAKPLLITHGFPSSVAEFMHLIEPLVNPAAGQAFHVVAPSLPGYAFSTPLGSAGWAMGRTARAHTLYEQAHSSDWGAPPVVPQGFAVFGADETVRKLVPAPDGAHWTEFPRGRHFPAMEAPAQLAEDLRAFFWPLR
jgi:pimeloyl-ACP methyl ester carboxylesterase